MAYLSCYIIIYIHICLERLLLNWDTKNTYWFEVLKLSIVQLSRPYSQQSALWKHHIISVHDKCFSIYVVKMFQVCGLEKRELAFCHKKMVFQPLQKCKQFFLKVCICLVIYNRGDQTFFSKHLLQMYIYPVSIDFHKKSYFSIIEHYYL